MGFYIVTVLKPMRMGFYIVTVLKPMQIWSRKYWLCLKFYLLLCNVRC